MTGLEDLEASQRAISNLLYQYAHDSGRITEPAATYWLVDPLDGTREFLAGHQDFTVNIALIEVGDPVAGAICAPALDQLYVAGATAHRGELAAGADLVVGVRRGKRAVYTPYRRVVSHAYERIVRRVRLQRLR
jgi:3'-phosphoadenosine 5'-phosphosulfate (PAPS) 3'-phosphatase